jgi:hypothetical protein
MTRATLGLLIPILLLAGAAVAQPPQDAPAVETPPAAAAPPATPKPAEPADKPLAGKPGPKVVEGLTVVGKGVKPGPCGERDKACIAMVVAELQARYPKQLKIWCHQEQDRAMWSNMEAEAIYGGTHAPIGGSAQLKPVMKTACETAKK